MKNLHLMLLVTFLAIISTSLAQNPIDAAVGSIQGQIDTAGQQLQEKAAQHILEGNFTQEHIAKDLNATKDKVTAEAKARVNQELDGNLNLTPEQLKLKAEEELKKQVNQQIAQQPGFNLVLAMLGILSAISLVRRRS